MSTIELRGFMGIADIFKDRKWPMPLFWELEEKISGEELLLRLNITKDKVEILFINGKVFLPCQAEIIPGDRVALVPPGTPGPYRVLLGFVQKKD
ncbi:MoaD/ThiS family protein [Dendrosporobacter sp. 1207_IL3150]|uniref:MoaD/ThiS family protein n=1 Tax=Dendrosporobacter sp. 1207_IL3150 TaxID=3084054 RepID=UPI002FD9BFCA